MPTTPATPPTKPRPGGLDKPLTTTIIRAMSRLHTGLYRATGGRLGKKWHVGSAVRKGVPVCLLITTGRKSGQPRTAPLLYMSEGERVILVASQGGLPTNPMWYLNLRTDPLVKVQIGRRTRRMRARTADPSERALLWPKLVDLYADFASYATWTDREIPVVICDPIHS